MGQQRGGVRVETLAESLGVLRLGWIEGKSRERIDLGMWMAEKPRRD